jgi:hypothetical protein
VNRETVLAYVFWHWRQSSVERDAYEAAQQEFHRALTASPSVGFIRSFSHAVAGLPWATQGGEANEDWYLVRDSAALDPLDAAAVTAGRKSAHDVAASLAASGTAGLYQMKSGSAPTAPRSSQWFSKPARLSYSQTFASVEPALRPVGGSLWMRRMTLGPSPEFCVLANAPATLATEFQGIAAQLRPIWDGPLAETASR